MCMCNICICLCGCVHAWVLMLIHEHMRLKARGWPQMAVLLFGTVLHWTWSYWFSQSQPMGFRYRPASTPSHPPLLIIDRLWCHGDQETGRQQWRWWGIDHPHYRSNGFLGLTKTYYHCCNQHLQTSLPQAIKKKKSPEEQYTKIVNYKAVAGIYLKTPTQSLLSQK